MMPRGREGRSVRRRRVERIADEQSESENQQNLRDANHAAENKKEEREGLVHVRGLRPAMGLSAGRKG